MEHTHPENESPRQQNEHAVSAARPTMLDIWREHRDSLALLGSIVGLPIMTIFALFIGLPIPRVEAERIMRVINALCGTHYTLDEIAGVQLLEVQTFSAEEERKQLIRAFFADVELEERPITAIQFQRFSATSLHMRAMLRTSSNEVALDFPATWGAACRTW